MSNRWFLLFLLVIVCVTQSGCELLTIPAAIIGGLFGLGSQALSIASTMPMPPPWVFF